VAGASGGWIGLGKIGRARADFSGTGIKASSIEAIVEKWEDKGDSALGKTEGGVGLARTV